MKKIAIAAACLLAAPVVLAGPFDAMKGKMKAGLYENKIEMEMGNLPPGMPALPFHFPLRNRIISGLARIVVVVEAAEKVG